VTLPKPPKVELQQVGDRTSQTDSGFLRLRRFDLVTVGPGGTKSSAFPYDVVERRALDACIMVAHHVENGLRHVWLRTAQRPPVVLRPIPPEHRDALWEVPAGLVEPGESPRAAAARELEEELGFHVAEASMLPLGPWVFPAPGFVGEIHFFFHCAVDPGSRREPEGDGSPLEAGATILSLPLDEALAACRTGEIRDSKTELALRRLAEI
jgi:ADP-ribose pyrophosphatase